ncbi:MAG: ubiquinol-cytochrome c reductase iron-sulfur subunit [Acidobacteriia bacterium]|nr:ubiquinol-cytochrome c reductase iron-sulfur subunit [Terriglobia bacterium]
MKDVGVLNTTFSPRTTRRGFYVVAIYAMGAIISAALGLPALVYLLVPPRVRRQSEWVEAGEVAQLMPGVPVEMTYRRNRVDGWKVSSEKSTSWVVKLPAGQIVAYSPICTHLGCAYHWEQARSEFVCPCHNSVFGMDGKVLEGPAPRPLDRYQTKVEGKQLLLGRLTQSDPTA